MHIVWSWVIGKRALPFIHQTTTKYTCQHHKEGENACTCPESIWDPKNRLCAVWKLRSVLLDYPELVHKAFLGVWGRISLYGAFLFHFIANAFPSLCVCVSSLDNFWIMYEDPDEPRGFYNGVLFQMYRIYAVPYGQWLCKIAFVRPTIWWGCAWWSI